MIHRESAYKVSCSPKVDGRDSSVRKAIRPTEGKDCSGTVLFRPQAVRGRTPLSAVVTVGRFLAVSPPLKTVRTLRLNRGRAEPLPDAPHEVFQIVAGSGSTRPGGAVSPLDFQTLKSALTTRFRDPCGYFPLAHVPTP